MKSIRRRFTLTFDVIQMSPENGEIPFTTMTNEELTKAMQRLFRQGTNQHIDWEEPLSCMYGPDPTEKFIPDDTMLDIKVVSVQMLK